MKYNVGTYMVVCFLELLVIFGIPVVATISIMNNWHVVFKIILSVLFGMEFVCILKYEWDNRER